MKTKMPNIKLSAWFISFTVVIAIVALISFKNDINSTFFSPQNYRIISPELPKEITFCDEEVPLYNEEVKENLEREIIVNTYWHSSTILLLKRANRWFPVIEPILEEHDIPEDLKYLALIESNLENVVSPAGATGFWQFMEYSGEKYGLEINGEIDERYNIEKSTVAACKYLKDSYEKYGSWTLATASYNMGTNGISLQIERQLAKNYYNLVLGEETERYVYRILALKLILNNPKDYGFYIPDEDLYEPYDTYEIEIKTPIKHWAVWAHDHGINYKILKQFNPWLRENYLTNKQLKAYRIKMPEEGSIKVIPD